MKIQINTMCFQYWKRLFWCLSSIVKQEKLIPNLKFRINILNDIDKFNNLKFNLMNIFNPILDIDWIEWDPNTGFETRSRIRNKDFENMYSDIDWILWIDPDQIFHPNHFNFLLNNLNEYKKKERLLSVYRINYDKELSNKIINFEKYDNPIVDCVEKIGGMSSIGIGPIKGDGYYQLVSTELIKSKNITSYCDIDNDTNLFKRLRGKSHYTTRSDRIFSKKFRMIRMIGAPPVFHLDHYRNFERDEYMKKDSL